MTSRQAQKWCWRLLLLLTWLRGILYIAVIPPWQSPDEPTHFEYAQVLAATPDLSKLQPDPELQREIIVSLDQHDYWQYVGMERPQPLPETFKDTPFLCAAPSQIGKNPPLYYLIASGILRIMPHGTIPGKMYSLRILSLIFSLLTIGMVYALAREIFPGEFWMALAVAAWAAFLPQFMVIGTSVSPDPLVNLLGSASIYLIVRAQRSGLTWARSFLVILLLALGLMVSYKFLVFIPILLGAALIHLLINRRRAFVWKAFFLWFFLSLLVLASGYSWLAWNFPGITRIFIVQVNTLASNLARCLSGKTIYPQGYWRWFNHELFKSFWLKFGWLRFELPRGIYLLLTIASGLSLLGILIMLIRWVGQKSPAAKTERESLLILLWTAAVTLGGYYLFWGLRSPETTTQARHLFLVLPAWAVLFVRGWIELFPRRLKSGVGVGLLLGSIMLDAVALFGYIIPTYGFFSE